MRWGVVLALILAAAPGLLHAQEGDTAPPQFDFGALAFSPGLVLSVGYDSNLNREPGAETRGSEVFVIPQMHGWWRAKRLVVTGIFAAEYVRAKDIEANQALTGAPKTNKLAEGMVTYKGPRLALSSIVSEKQTNARPTGFEIGARSVRVEKTVAGEAVLKFGARSDLTAQVSRLRMNWDADQIYNGSVLAANLDGQFLTSALRATVALTPVTAVFGGVEFVDQQFFLAPVRDNTSRHVQAGVAFAPPGLLSGQVVVGNRRVTAKATDGSDVSGLTLRGNVTYSRPTGAALTATVERDKQASYDITQGFFRTTGGTLMLNSRLLRGWTAFTSAAYYRFSYTEPIQRFETHVSYGGGAYYRPRPRLRIGVVGERYDRTAAGGLGVPFSGFLFRVYTIYGSKLARPLDRPLP